eukprot:gene13035-13164_t
MILKDSASAMHNGRWLVKGTAVTRGSYCSTTVRRSARQVHVVRAEAAADSATIAPEKHASVTVEASSACPFLASLPARTPPLVHVPWLKRFNQLFKPQQFQAELASAASGDKVIEVGKQLGFLNCYVPLDGELVKEVFSGETIGNTKQAEIPSFVNLMGKHSLVVVQDPQHKYLRTLLQPAFEPSSVARYVPDIESLVRRHLSMWEAAGQVQALDGFKRMTTEFILQITLGRQYSMDELQQLAGLYQQWVSGFLAWPWLDIPFTPYAKAVRARAGLLSHFQEAVDAARTKIAAGQEVPGVIGQLVTAVDDQGNMLTDEQICENILLLLLAGHDTSSTTLTLAMSNLQDHPEVVEKLRQEQQELVAKHGEPLTAAFLKDMVYADAVIRETLRCDPIVAGLFRVAAKDFQLGQYQVPEGMHMLLPMHQVARTDPRWASSTGDLDPARFNPERMMTPEGQKPGAQVPFGWGNRYCLGVYLAMAEMKAFLAVLARCYSFTADNNTEWQQAVGKVPVNGLPVVITPL